MSLLRNDLSNYIPIWSCCSRVVCNYYPIILTIDCGSLSSLQSLSVLLGRDHKCQMPCDIQSGWTLRHSLMLFPAHVSLHDVADVHHTDLM